MSSFDVFCSITSQNSPRKTSGYTLVKFSNSSLLKNATSEITCSSSESSGSYPVVKLPPMI